MNVSPRVRVGREALPDPEGLALVIAHRRESRQHLRENILRSGVSVDNLEAVVREFDRLYDAAWRNLADVVAGLVPTYTIRLD